MSRLLELLLRFLTLGVGPGEEDDAGGDPPATEIDDEGSTGDDSFDDLLDLAEKDGGEPVVDKDETPAVKEARRRESEARAELEREREARRNAEARIPPPAARPDVQYEAEERELEALRASGADATALQWKKWQIDSNRNIRANGQASQSALLQAQDVSDRTAFERLEITKPKVYKAYAERVEKAMAEMRSRGQNAPRLAVLRLLIGDDIMNGKVKPKAAKKEPAAPAGVDRGRTPGVRSDVRAKGNGKLTPGQEAAKRLDGVHI